MVSPAAIPPPAGFSTFVMLPVTRPFGEDYFSRIEYAPVKLLT